MEFHRPQTARGLLVAPERAISATLIGSAQGHEAS
jgi:hypothetical protein